jgi:hypothetical protein
LSECQIVAPRRSIVVDFTNYFFITRMYDYTISRVSLVCILLISSAGLPLHLTLHRTMPLALQAGDGSRIRFLVISYPVYIVRVLRALYKIQQLFKLSITSCLCHLESEPCFFAAHTFGQNISMCCSQNRKIKFCFFRQILFYFNFKSMRFTTVG